YRHGKAHFPRALHPLREFHRRCLQRRGVRMSRDTRALIDLAALRHNLEVARRSAPGSRIMAVVKANAYGHGLLPAARALAAADGFAVSSLAEAVPLREAG